MPCPRCGEKNCVCKSNEQKALNVRESLDSLIRQAEVEGKWLRCSYQGITFSPKELRAENAQGKFCWGPQNWLLFDPEELMQNVEELANQARKYNDDIRRRML